MFLDSIVVFKLVFSQHFIQDAVDIVAIIGGKGKNTLIFFTLLGSIFDKSVSGFLSSVRIIKSL